MVIVKSFTYIVKGSTFALSKAVAVAVQGNSILSKTKDYDIIPIKKGVPDAIPCGDVPSVARLSSS